MKRLFLIHILFLILVACQKEEQQYSEAGRYLYATIEEVAPTKTCMNADNQVLWSEDDQIVALLKSSVGLKYQVLPTSADKTSATFEKVPEPDNNQSSTDEWDHNVLYYPYSNFTRATKSSSYYILTVGLPSVQIYSPGSFGKESFPMTAVSESNNFSFRNVLGGMKLQLKGTQKIASITLQGMDGEKLSGAATIRAYMSSLAPSITLGSTSSETVTLNCGEDGVQLNENSATDFIIALPPVVFDLGFKVTITDTDNKTYVISTDKSNSIQRSTLLVMPEVTVEAKRKIDYVDEYGINQGKGILIGETIWAPVNCGYHATDYKYGKLYQWGRKYGQGYDEADASVPTIEAGGSITVEQGNSESKSNVFFTSTSDLKYNWLPSAEGLLWNTGSEASPVKTDYDPCPSGWRVPTRDELKILSEYKLSWETNAAGQNGSWFGDSAYAGTEGAQMFLLGSGLRNAADGSAANRTKFGYYWSSMPYNVNYSIGLFIGSTGNIGLTDYRRANALSVRCVQE